MNYFFGACGMSHFEALERRVHRHTGKYIGWLQIFDFRKMRLQHVFGLKIIRKIPFERVLPFGRKTNCRRRPQTNSTNSTNFDKV